MLPPIATTLSRRPATPDDVPFLLELRRQTMSNHQLASGITPSHEERMRRVKDRLECAQILLHQGKPAGLLKVDTRTAVWELVQIQLTPALHGQGIGAALLQELITAATKAQASIELSVLKMNPARALYERLGFVITQEETHSYTMLRS